VRLAQVIREETTCRKGRRNTKTSPTMFMGGGGRIEGKGENGREGTVGCEGEKGIGSVATAAGGVVG